MAGLQSSGASSGHSSPQPMINDHHHHHDMIDDNRMSSLSVSPPSTSSECGSGASSRRPSMPDHMKDDTYREKRKRNNDSARRSREKRKLNDVAMEKKLLELTRENNLLKSRLTTNDPEPPRPTPTQLPALPDLPQPSSTCTPSSVIVAGPSMPSNENLMPKHRQDLFHFSGFPQAAAAERQDLFYPLDLSQAAAMAAAAFKMQTAPNTPSNAFFNQQLLAAAAAAASHPQHLLAPVIPGMNGFGLIPPSAAILKTVQPSAGSGNEHNPALNGFSSIRSAFQPFSTSQTRPTVIDMLPAQPRGSATSSLTELQVPGQGQGHRPTSVIHCNPIINGRSDVLRSHHEMSQSRPSVVQNSLGHVQFISQLPLAQEPRLNVYPRPPGPPRGPVIQPPPQATGSSSQSLLGSLLSNRHSPTVPETRTIQQSGLANEKMVIPVPSAAVEDRSSEELKTSLSTLAVHLHTTSSSSSSRSSHHGLKSDSDSLSPHSTHSTRSGSDEMGSHHEDHLMHDSSSTTGTHGDDKKPEPGSAPREMERYRDRRRRNNEAAKRCRANRRAAFEYRSKRSQQLESENSDLRQEMLKLNNELEQLKSIIAANNRLLPTQ